MRFYNFFFFFSHAFVCKKCLILRIVSVKQAIGQSLVGREYLIDSERDWILGKVPSADPSCGSVVVEHKFVSAQHAKISVKDSVSMEVSELPKVQNGTKG